MVFVSVASKGVSCTVSRLNATLAGFCVSVADRGVRDSTKLEVLRWDVAEGRAQRIIEKNNT